MMPDYRMNRVIAVLILVLLCIVPLEAKSKKKTRKTNRPGVFDYYVLSLSWSPQYCAGPSGANDTVQCGAGRRFGFVVHGLWPQFERGYPQSCKSGSNVPASLVNSMLPLMPSPKLIEHEWDKHGTCSGLSVTDYFRLIQRAFAAVRIPDEFKGPVENIEVSPAEAKARFVRDNSTYPPQAFTIQCSGRDLSEVRVCMTKDLKGRSCGADVRDSCRGDSTIVRPVR
jgi:ribonuclease T2